MTRCLKILNQSYLMKLSVFHLTSLFQSFLFNQSFLRPVHSISFKDPIKRNQLVTFCPDSRIRVSEGQLVCVQMVHCMEPSKNLRGGEGTAESMTDRFVSFWLSIYYSKIWNFCITIQPKNLFSQDLVLIISTGKIRESHC